jgi:DmsE family decaheme c-type cytochrome
MTLPHKVSVSSLCCIALFLATAALAANKFNLKPGATGKICLECHVDFQEKLKRASIHTPVKAGECSGCHNPHSSSHGKLLAAAPGRVCSQCHGEMAPETARSRHQVVAEGNCVACHDPHAADNQQNLVKAGNDLCFGCHQDIGEAVTTAKFKHSPVQKGCVNCHDPHASEKFDHLVKTDVPALCLKCHKTNKPAFLRQHSNYPVAKGRCTSCHNPHGSDKPVILYANVHPPVMTKRCNQCHEDPASAAPFKTKKAGFELCQGCHSNMINAAFGKRQVHWALVGKQGCLSCHTPHASTETGLLQAAMTTVCGACHSDTIQRQEASLAKHEPVQEGNCTLCHTPHASDAPLLMTDASSIVLCSGCHNWSAHSSHPIGAKFPDMRNQNLTVTCLSCHRSHGTAYKKLIPFATSTDLCVQCHARFKR